MFDKNITQTVFTDTDANYLFSNITGEGHRSGDTSFLSTMRALVFPRMKDDECIHLEFRESNHSASTLSGIPIHRALNAIYAPSGHEPGDITIHEFRAYSKSDNIAWMELMKSSFVEVCPGWERIEKVTDFFRKSFYVLCFVHSETKRVALFSEGLDIKKLHYLQCAILAFMPWYFKPEDGVTDLEMNLVKSLREKTHEAYIDALSKLSEKYDFRTEKIKRLLKGFEIRHHKIRAEEMKANIDYYMGEIKSLLSTIDRYMRNKAESEILLLGLEETINSGAETSEIMDYFLCNKYLILDSVTDTDMIFVSRGYVEYFDEDMAERTINNRNSYIYSDKSIDDDDTELLMRAIFIDQVIRVRVCAAYRFNMNGGVDAQFRYPYVEKNCGDFTPNPHIDEYQCMGDYTMHITELLSRHDYIGAIEQCNASCKSLNFADSVVMSEFMRRLKGSSPRQDNINIKCMELPSGEVVSPTEAIEWLKGRSKTNE